MQNNQAVYVPQQAGAPPPQYRKKDDGVNQAVVLGSGIFFTYCIIVSCLVFICCCLPIIVGVSIGLSNAGNDNGVGDNDNDVGNDDYYYYYDDEVGLLPPSSEEVRTGDDHVGVLFAVEPPEVARDAFVSAAARWSDIVRGTDITGFLIFEGRNACNFGIFNETFFLDHLMIVSVIDSIDGPGRVLASAGPCLIQTVGNSFPVVGVMTFDSDDISGLLFDGTFETVILHEMGHVLGIGTLWSRATQGAINVNVLPNGQSLILDAVIDDFTGNINGNNRPTFLGNNANDAYQRLEGNEAAVPIEDGIFPAGNNFNNANGGGSVDGHWNLEDFINELMIFQINPANVVFPLSEVTIASLQDLGYTTNLALADAFTVPNSNKRRRAKKTFNAPGVHNLVNDILDIEPIFLE